MNDSSTGATRRFRHPISAARNRALTEAYGFGLFPLPAYAAQTEEADWTITAHGPGMARGYLARLAPEPGRHVLYHRREAWMSTGLMEQESHAPHVHFAHGVVVAAGLGLGMFAHAVALKDEVERVVVIDSSPEVMALIERATNPARWPQSDKLRFILGDALAPETAEEVLKATDGKRPDYLYADIWPIFPAPEAPEQTACMVRALAPKQAGWWGQELSFGQWCHTNALIPDHEALERYAQETAVPLVITDGYVRFCRDAIAANLDGRRQGAGFLSALWGTLRQKMGSR